MRFITLLFLKAFCLSVSAQPYTSYFTGNTTDAIVTPLGGICLMGGASEHDEAMKWFLQKCNGGDVLVLRASGSNGYNTYLYSSLGVAVNSVESIVCHSAGASYDSYVQQKIMQAEGIWFAGGDQWDYVSYWRHTPVDSLINLAIQNRNIVIGGTSAGMAILGGFYFSAQNGSVTSAAALANPYNSRVTVDSANFIDAPWLNDVITDTHYDDPDRKGRHVTFLARILTDWGIEARGIACDEYTAVCIEPTGLAHVYGDFPGNDDNAYFIQTNCELAVRTPEDCSSGNPLEWQGDSMALKVYAVKGTFSGNNTFDLIDWKTGTGGSWQNWFVTDGTLHTGAGQAVDCQPTVVAEAGGRHEEFIIYPNPAHEQFITIDSNNNIPISSKIVNTAGQIVAVAGPMHSGKIRIDVSGLPAGIYFLQIKLTDKSLIRTIVLY